MPVKAPSSPLATTPTFRARAAQFAQCYEPTWGRHRDRTRPTPGNHEYETAGASAYFSYFGENAGPGGLGYYSFEVGNWHIVSLNSNVLASDGSAQMQWLRQDLAVDARALRRRHLAPSVVLVGTERPGSLHARRLARAARARRRRRHPGARSHLRAVRPAGRERPRHTRTACAGSSSGPAAQS